jgi:hypothetical protein
LDEDDATCVQANIMTECFLLLLETLDKDFALWFAWNCVQIIVKTYMHTLLGAVEISGYALKLITAICDEVDALHTL